MTKRWLLIGAVFLLGLMTGIGVMLASRSSAGAGREAASTATMTESTQGKQLYTCGMHPQVIQDHPGNCPICHMKLTPLKSNDDEGPSQASAGKGQKKVLYWWDPMLGPSSISNKPGKSAMGMEMVPVYEDQASAGPAVKIDPTIVQNMGIRTAQVTRGPLEKTVRTVGMIEPPESGLYDVTLKINGYIDKLYANQEGMHVHKGEPLFDLYSPDLQVAEEELISAARALATLDPKASDVVRKESENLVASAKRKLRLWDIADEDIEAIAKADKPPKTITFRSPAGGEIVDKMVVEGSSVQAGMKLMRVEDHSTMWLKVQVYEEQMPVVKLGQTVEATAEALPGQTFTGPITFVYPHLDHMARTSIVRVTLDNSEMKLRPGMYATAKIITKPVADAVLVPREAVIDTGTRQIAFVVKSEGRFDPRKVRMGMSGDGDVVEILEGLMPGETVVTSGQFLMDVESRTTEAINKLRGAQGQQMGGKMEQMSMAMPAPAATTSTTPPAPATVPVADAASAPATEPARAAQPLVVAHCPMKNADWVQTSETINNPYYGSSMLGCGEVTKKVSAPPPGSDLDKVAQAYIELEKSLTTDQFKPEAARALKAATGSLSGDQFTALRQAADRLAAVKDINGARTELQAVSKELIGVLEQPPK